MEKKDKSLLISISGIRGTVHDGLDVQKIISFIEAFCLITGKKIIIGHDGRGGSSAWMKHLCLGVLLSHGKRVLDADLAPTPSIKCAACVLKADAGIIITASHNPIIWNGFKFITRKGFFFSVKEWGLWRNALEIGIFNQKRRKQLMKGSIEKVDAVQIHIDKIIHAIPEFLQIKKHQFTVAIDPVCGAGCYALPRLLSTLSCKVIAIHNYENQEKDYPRDPEPNQASLEKLGRLVKKTKATVGFGVDPDCDRLIVASPKRGVISEEYTLPLALAGFLKISADRSHQPRLSASKNSEIVINYSTSNVCERIILEESYPISLRTIRAPVGEPNVVAKMQEKKILFGGEGNGGVIFSEVPSFGRDPLVGITLILFAISADLLQQIDSIIDRIAPIHMKKEKMKINLKISEEKFLKNFEKKVKGMNPAIKTDHSDGLFIDFLDDSWLHIRSSNTEPVIRMIGEARSEKLLDALMRQANSFIRQCNHLS